MTLVINLYLLGKIEKVSPGSPTDFVAISYKSNCSFIPRNCVKSTGLYVADCHQSKFYCQIQFLQSLCPIYEIRSHKDHENFGEWDVFFFLFEHV